jgi:hypothetical protein
MLKLDLTGNDPICGTSRSPCPGAPVARDDPPDARDGDVLPGLSCFDDIIEVEVME